jgi:hypothetical protein
MQGIRRTGTIVAVVLALLIPVGLRAQSAAGSGENSASVARAQALADVEANRSTVIRDTVDRWRSQFRPADPSRNIGGDEGQLTAALRKASAENLLAASQAQTYEEALAAVRGRWQGPSVIPLEPGQAIPNTLGSTAGDLVFTPITPCRIFDTRAATGLFAGKVGPGGTWPGGNWFSVNLASFTAQGGAASCPGMPTTFDPSAVALNLTSTGQTGVGNLRLVECGGGTPPVSLLNYTPGVNLANAAVIRSAIGCTLGPGGSNDMFVFSTASASDVVVDLMGYFAPPVATALDQTFPTSALVSVPAGAGGTASSPDCPAGYSVTGGSCIVFSFSMHTVTTRRELNHWFCSTQNQSAAAVNLQVEATCSRIPGR